MMINFPCFYALTIMYRCYHTEMPRPNDPYLDKSNMDILCSVGLVYEKLDNVNFPYEITEEGRKYVEGFLEMPLVPLDIEEKIQCIKIALALSGVPIGDMMAELIIRSYEEVIKKGDQFSIRDSSKIQADIEEKYKEKTA